MRFLIVSPDDNLRSRLADDLRSRSFIVDEARPEHAARAEAPDRVVIDVARASTPGGAMLSALRDVTAAFPEARVIVLAPYPSAALMRISMRLGAVHCVARNDNASSVLAAFDEAEAPLELLPRPDMAFATLEEARWQHIARALEVSRGNISGAARLLGIHRQSLQRILRSIRPESGEAKSDDDVERSAEAAS